MQRSGLLNFYRLGLNRIHRIALIGLSVSITSSTHGLPQNWACHAARGDGTQRRANSVTARFLLITSAMIVLGACSTARYHQNLPLAPTDQRPPYTYPQLDSRTHDDGIFMFVSFSGGGSRAAALAFGVTEALDHYRFSVNGVERSLYDEIDVLTTVSGGSLFGAHLALHGRDSLRTFPDILKKRLQRQLTLAWLSPRGLFRTTSSHFGRSDLLQEILDREVFAGATFADLAKRRERPLLVIRATDMSRGLPFNFSHDAFQSLCSDLASFPVARAVAASMAVPVLLSPVTLQNHAEKCPRSFDDAAGLDQRDYVHLMDGGLVDNLGARGPIDYVGEHGNLINAAGINGVRSVTRVVYVLVNSETLDEIPEDVRSQTPGMSRTLRAWIDIPISRYTHESVNVVREYLSRWEAEVRHPENDGAVIRRDAKFYFVEVSLPRRQRNPLAKFLNAIPTALELQGPQVELLRAHAREQLEASPEMKRLVRDIGARVAPMPKVELKPTAAPAPPGRQ